MLELLVSMAVLALLLAMVAQLVNSTALITGTGNKRMDTDSQARLLFDRMALDFGKIVKRPDVDYYFLKNTGNDQMAFFSEVAGYNPNGVSTSAIQSGVSLVGYWINANYQLERLGKALICTDATNAMVFSSTAGTLTAAWPGIVDGSDANYQVIADRVYRLEYDFLLKPYTDSTGKQKPSVLSLTPWDTRQNHTTANGLADVSAIVVAIGLLDDTSRKIVQAGQYAGMVSALPDASNSTSILQSWSGGSYLTGSGIPRTAMSQLRIYQRTFYLCTTP